MALYRRQVEDPLAHRLADSAVVRLSGPRTCGKTTTCAAVHAPSGGSQVRLDDPDVRRAVQADPVGYLAGAHAPVFVDEYQHVPEVVDVIKSDLSRHGHQPGKWLLCGSVSINAVTPAAETLGGRLTDIRMGTLTLDERDMRTPPLLLRRLLDEGPVFLRGWRASGERGRQTLLGEAAVGGFPLVVAQRDDERATRRILSDWVSASVIADGAEVGGVRHTEELRRMLQLYAAATATITPKDRPTADRLGIERRTIARYRNLLSDLYVTWDLPAYWPGNATGQVTRSPKLHLVDSGLAAHLAGRDTLSALDRDPGFAGQLIETMVVNDLRAQAEAVSPPPWLGHYREEGHEVDLVIETPDGRIHGIEIKLSARPGSSDLAGLRRLARSAGERFAGGVVLARVKAGQLTDDGLAIAPIDAVWDVGQG